MEVSQNTAATQDGAALPHTPSEPGSLPFPPQLRPGGHDGEVGLAVRSRILLRF